MPYRLFLAAVWVACSTGTVAAQQPFSSRPPSAKDDSATQDRTAAEQENPADGERALHYRLTLDEYLVLVPIRAEDDIRSDIDDSRRQEDRAREEKRSSEQLERLARDQLAAQKSEIDAIKARLKVAKNDDRKADVTVLEADRKLAEGAEDLLEKRRDLRRVEVRGWDMVAKLAVATRQAAELELELASARERLKSDGPRGSAEVARRLERRVNELEKRTLEAQKDRAELRAKVAQTEKDVVDSRLDLLKTRAKINAGG